MRWQAATPSHLVCEIMASRCFDRPRAPCVVGTPSASRSRPLSEGWADAPTRGFNLAGGRRDRWHGVRTQFEWASFSSITTSKGWRAGCGSANMPL